MRPNKRRVWRFLKPRHTRGAFYDPSDLKGFAITSSEFETPHGVSSESSGQLLNTLKHESSFSMSTVAELATPGKLSGCVQSCQGVLSDRIGHVNACKCAFEKLSGCGWEVFRGPGQPNLSPPKIVRSPFRTKFRSDFPGKCPLGKILKRSTENWPSSSKLPPPPPRSFQEYKFWIR